MTEPLRVSITFCTAWSYEPHAAGLAAELKKRLGAEVELIKGSGGIFDVVANGAKIFSKHETGRFPEPGEIAELLRRGAP